MVEISAGGVVIVKNTILVLKKYSGILVLPKGRREPGESMMETALREVREETSVRARIIDYIGHTDYEYKSIYVESDIEKTVHWYLMTTSNLQTQPQKIEGFKESSFIHFAEALECLEYDNERDIARKAVSMFEGRSDV